MELRVTLRDDGITHVQLTGKLDVEGLHLVDAQFHEVTAIQGQPSLVDLSQLEFISSLGMGMLISCSQSLRRHGARMVLLCPSQDVEEVLRLSRFEELMPICHSLAEALQILHTRIE
ncbi:MAG: anti-sigma B factor antagonist [Pirellulaceae bacterium]|jgi:anti-sigma B factor antagonist